MGCITSSRAVGIHAPSHVKGNDDDPCSIQWNDNARDEDGYIIYVVGYNVRYEHDRVGQNVEDYSFEMKSCEVAEHYFGEWEIDPMEHVLSLTIEVEVFKEGESPPENEKWSSDPVRIWDRRNLPENGGDAPLEAPKISETVDYNPCTIWWEHSGAGFYPCSVEGEEGFRIYVGIFPEAQTPSIDDNGWIWLATVDKNARSNSFGILCDQIFDVGYGEKAWAFVEAFSTRNLLGDGDAFSDIVLLHHSEAPTLDPLDPAYYQEAIKPQSRLGDNVIGEILTEPENITFDGFYETENIYQSYKSQVKIRDGHPYIKITGDANNTQGRTEAKLEYSFQLYPKTSNAPMDVSIPIIITSQGYASVSESLSLNKAYAHILIELYNHYPTTVSACGEPEPYLCQYPNYSELYVVNDDLFMDFSDYNQGRIYLTASLDLLYGKGEVVFMEPIIQIDPTHMIDGERAIDLYEIIFSDGILPPTT